MVPELNVDWAEPEKFWKKSEEERFQYFKNTSLQYFTLLDELKEDPKWTKKANMAKEVFTNVMFFLVFLMTTKEEQQQGIVDIWIDRFITDIKEMQDIFISLDKVGTA